MRHSNRPIITLTTDFGLRDYYVAAMKAVLLTHCPDARLIDVTHQVPRHDILCGSITLERAIDGFPRNTVHLAVVDPGVGTDRKILIVEINNQIVVCPDNGLITWAWRLHSNKPALGGRVDRPEDPALKDRLAKVKEAFLVCQAHELTWRPKAASSTFHGRDIMAPVAGMIAAGTKISTISKPLADPVLLDVSPSSLDRAGGQVIHIDTFGNATTNIAHARLRKLVFKDVKIKGKKIAKLKRTYWDVAPGKPLALIGSSGLLEIAVRDGDASKQLKLKVGDEVNLI